MARITEETIKSWSFETKQLHIGQEDYDHATDARAVPIYQTSNLYVLLKVQDIQFHLLI